jgi:hypothetical protein
MYKLKPTLEAILKHRRSKEDREKNRIISINQMIQQYIKDGSKGDLALGQAPITTLPDNLETVGGNLYLSGSRVKKLPDALRHIKGSLYLREADIEELSDGLYVGGRIVALWAEKLNRLPNRLTVGEGLDISYSGISELPTNIKVGGDFSVTNTPLSDKYTTDELHEKLPEVIGMIHV